MTICFNGGGAAYLIIGSGNELNFSGCTFAGNSAVASAIYISSFYIQSTSAMTYGGAICAYGGGTVVMENTVFRNNSVFCSGEYAASATTLRLYGGAIYAGGSTTVRFTYGGDSRYCNTDNRAEAGGFLYLDQNASAVFNFSSSTTFENNVANSGGFMYLNGATAEFNIGQGLVIIGHDPIDDILVWGVPAAALTPNLTTDSIAGSGTIIINGGSYSEFQLRGDASKFTGNWVIKENSYMSLRGYGNGINNVSIASGAKLIAVAPRLSGASVAAGGTLAVLGGSGVGLDVYGTLMAGTDRCGGTAITNAVIHSGGSIVRFNDTPYHADWWNLYYDCEPTLTNVTLENGAYAILGNSWTGKTFKLGCASTASAALLNTASATYLDPTASKGSATSLAITSGSNLAVLSGGAVLAGSGRGFEVANAKLTVLSGATLSGGTIYSGGNLVLSSGGTVRGGKLHSGGSAVFYGGYVEYLDVSSGGQVIVSGGEVLLSELIMSGNVFDSGTAWTLSSADVTISGGTISDNTGYHDGGAIYAPTGILTINDVIFSGNYVTGYVIYPEELYNRGGAISVRRTDMSISNATFRDNHADGPGGAIYALDSNLAIADTDFIGNSAHAGSYGGGGAIDYKLLFADGDFYITLSNCNFSDNEFIAERGYEPSIVGYGGGAAIISLSNANIDFCIDNSTFTNNRTAGNIASSRATGFMGGGALLLEIYIPESSMSASISNTVFTGNTASNTGRCDATVNGGGAVYISYDAFAPSNRELYFSGCEFAYNSAVASAVYDSGTQRVVASTCGGAICATGNGNIIFSDTIFSGNSACCSGELAESNAVISLYGGAVYVGHGVSVSFIYDNDDININSGNASKSGGFLYLDSSTALFDISNTKCRFNGNTAGAGGFMYVNNGTVTFNLNSGTIVIGDENGFGTVSSGVAADSIAGSGTIIVDGDQYSEFLLHADASQFTGNWIMKEDTYMAITGYGNVINNISIASGARLDVTSSTVSNAEIAFGGSAVFFGGSGTDISIISGGSAIVSGGKAMFDNLIMSGNEFASSTTLTLLAADVTISGGTISDNTGYHDGGAIYASTGMLTINDVIFSGNYVTGYGAPDILYNRGGAISLYYANAIINNTTFSDNHADGPGGAVNAINGNLNISNTRFTGNYAHDGAYGGGGALRHWLLGTQGDFSVTLSDCNFSDNGFIAERGYQPSFVGEGGGAAFIAFSTLHGDIDFSIDDSTFTNNRTAGNIASLGSTGFSGGGALLLTMSVTDNSISANISHTIFTGNTASNTGGNDAHINGGGAIYMYLSSGCEQNISGCKFNGNSAVASAIYDSSTKTVIARTCGGAICVGGSGTVSLENTVFSGNTVGCSGELAESATVLQLYGGAVYVGSNVTAKLIYDGFYTSFYHNTDNKATAGGFIYVDSGAMAVFELAGCDTHCNFSGNVADSGGFMYLNGGNACFIIESKSYRPIMTIGNGTSTDSIAGSGTIMVNNADGGILKIMADVSGFTGVWGIENGIMEFSGSGNVISNVHIASGAEVKTQISTLITEVEIASGGLLSIYNGSGSALDIYGSAYMKKSWPIPASISSSTVHSGATLILENGCGNIGSFHSQILNGVTLERGALIESIDYYDASSFIGCGYCDDSATISVCYANWEYYEDAVAISSGCNLSAIYGTIGIVGECYELEILSGDVFVLSGAVLSGTSVGEGVLTASAGSMVNQIILTSGATLNIKSGAMVDNIAATEGSATLIASGIAINDKLLIADGASLDLICADSVINVCVDGSGELIIVGSSYYYGSSYNSVVSASYYNSNKFQAAGWNDHAEVCYFMTSGSHLSSGNIYNLRWTASNNALPLSWSDPVVGSNRCIEITSGGSFYQADGTIDQVIVRSGGELGLSPGYATDQSSSRIVATNIIIESGGSVNALTCNRFAASGFCELDRTGIRTTVSAGTIVYSGGITSGHNLRGSYNQTILGNAELITWANYYSILTIDSGASVTGLELLRGASVLLNSGAKLSGSLDVALYHPKDGGASVRNLTSFDGITLKVNADALTSDCGAFTIVSGVTAETITVTIAGVDHVLSLNQTVALANGSYTYRTEGNSMILDVTGKFDSVCGQSGTSSTLKVSDCRVKSIIAGASGDVTGSVTASIELAAEASPCNIYGGGNNANVGGKISLSLTGGGYTGTIYGGSRAYQKTISTGDVAIAVGAIVQTNNVKILKSGESAWVVGGGTAYDGTLKAGTVSITIDGASLVHVVGGAQAQAAGTAATVASTAITIRNAAISGDVFGGGYAYDHAESTVLGDVSMTFDASNSKMVTVQGTIYGGGANPSHPSMGGSSVVEGDATITFTGSGDYLAVSTVSGDGKVAGTVLGVKTLSFENFTGDFLGVIQSFDVVSFSGNTAMDYSGGYAASTIAFDLTGRTELEAFADGFSFVDGGDNLLKIELGATTGSYDLLTCDDFDALEGLKVELYKQGALYASFDYGDSAKGYTVGERNGCLALLA